MEEGDGERAYSFDCNTRRKERAARIARCLEVLLFLGDDNILGWRKVEFQYKGERERDTRESVIVCVAITTRVTLLLLKRYAT